MVSLTFYGGVGEIGGNKVLLRDGEKALFLDFGTPFSRRARYYEEYLNPRPGAGLVDFLEMGLLPRLRGIYRPDLEPTGLWERFPAPSLESLDGVLLSHAHLDHSGYISFLRKDIPVYASAFTAFIAKAIQDSGKSDLEHEICYFAPRQPSHPKGWGLGALEAGDWKRVPTHQRPFRIALGPDLSPEALSFWEETPGARELKATPLRPCPPSPLPLRAFPLDHSIPGATAWAVETSAGWVVYTGDIRFHGQNRHLSQRFVEEATRLQPKALLAEGTYIETRLPPVTEAEVYENALRAIQGTPGLVIADFAARDVERLFTFLQIARECQRQLVILPRDAYLLQALRLLSDAVPDIASAEAIAIYQEAKSKTDRWERQVSERYQGKMVLPEQVRRHQSSFILCFSFFDLNELPSIRPGPGGLYLYSSSEAHNEEQQIDLKRLRHWLEHFNLCPCGLPQETAGKWVIPPGEQGLHASGHASGEELVKMVKEIAPQVFIPIHTEVPELFQQRLTDDKRIKVHIPKEGEELSL